MKRVFARQQGFGAITAIMVLVILGALAAAIITIGTTQQMTSAQDVLSARAWQAARAGNEWGLYQALKGSWSNCNNVSQTLNLTAESGFYVTVTCNSWLYNEGETTPGTPKQVRIYRILAVACPVAGCPLTTSEVANPGYIERSRVIFATDQ